MSLIRKMDETKIKIIVLDGSTLWDGEESATLENFQAIDVSSSLSPNEIIQSKLKLPIIKKTERIPTGPQSDQIEGGGREFTLETFNKLECPSLQVPLNPDLPISEQGIVDNTVFVLGESYRRVYDHPSDEPKKGGARRLIKSIRDVHHFKQALKSQVDEMKKSEYFGPDLFAALLYTDEDTELAKYVRLNFSSLNQMSSFITIYIVERPPQKSLAETIRYWKELLEFNAYVFWGGIGWTKTKPYDRAGAYNIAKQLGIFPHQFPCIVFFKKSEDEEKVIVQIKDDFSNFFRKIFGSIQKYLPYSRWSLSKDDRRYLIDIKKIIEMVFQVGEEKKLTEISYPISYRDLYKIDFGDKKMCKLLSSFEKKDITPPVYQNHTKILAIEIEKYVFVIDEVSNILIYRGDERTKKMKLRKDLKEYLWIKTLKYFLLEEIENPATFEEIYDWVMKEEPCGYIKNTVQSWISELRQRLDNDLEWFLTPVEDKGYNVVGNKIQFCIFERIQ